VNNLEIDNVNPLALCFLAICCVIVFVGSPRNAVSAFLVTAAFIPLGQKLVILGLNFHFLRLIILVGMLRIISRGELAQLQLTRPDRLFIIWAVIGLLCAILRGAKAENFGFAYNALGSYFIVRSLVRDPEDILAQLRVLAVASMVIAVCMLFEYVSRRNPFYVFGGVPDVLMERGDRVRCQGPFRIPILAGTFAATLFPILAGCFWARIGSRTVMGLGALACGIMTVLSNSSGPLLCFLASVFGLFLWRYRSNMRLYRRATVVAIIGLAMVMKAPVWYLIARISDIVGGGGWHRAYVIDVAVNHFTEWFLIGTSVTAHWAPAGQVLLVDPNNMDITNYFVAQCVGGGVIMLGIFIYLLVLGFSTIGKLVRSVNPVLDARLLWTFGVALASHCTAFLSISYFDQISVFWYWILALLSYFATLSFHTAPVLATAGEIEPQTAATPLAAL
jgi:hypothetical protein